MPLSNIGSEALVTQVLMIKIMFVQLLLHETEKKPPVLFRVTDTLSLQFLLFHVWWMYCQFGWGRVHPRYPNMAYQLCVFVEASCWVHDISGCLQSHPISKLRLEFQTKPCYKAGFSERARHSYNVEISGSFLSTLFNPLSDRHNCKVV